jgi:AbrB family looped-hinge helix DNA binding protein
VPRHDLHIRAAAHVVRSIVDSASSLLSMVMPDRHGIEMASRWVPDGRFVDMRVTMDRAGRVVLPKPLREQLGLDEGAQFEVVVEGWTVRLEPLVRPVRAVVDVDGWPVLEERAGVALTDDDVRALREADRR